MFDTSGQLVLDGNSLTIEDIVRVSADKTMKVFISEPARAAMTLARQYVEKIALEHKVVYGITTGFGQFKNVILAGEQLRQVQENLIMSHSVGVGKPLAEADVRAAILVRANSLIKGYSGVRIELVERLLDLLNNGIYPFVPEKGSVGASGDLCPLAHIMLVILGLGEVIENGVRASSADILRKYGLTPMPLASKEGLALTNGTSVMTGMSALLIAQAENLAKLADISAATCLESTMGTLSAFSPLIQAVRPHRGQAAVAENMRRICMESEIMESHKNCGRVQDSYSLRCIPQVHGAVRDSLAYIRSVIETEINSATDNPLIFPEHDAVISGGNFHGEPIAFVMDFLGIVVSELGSISERRINRMVDSSISEGLPAFLIPKEQAGVSSGYMIAQYTAAALVSENKVLAHPASVDSIPTSANQEDHVSMGSIAVRKAKEITKNVYSVIAIEITCGAQALDFRHPLRPGFGARQLHEIIRQIIPFAEKDRVLYPDFEVVEKLMLSGRLLSEIENRIGKLN